MVALDAKYHAKCLVSLYNRARKAKNEGHSDEANITSGIAFAELVMYIEDQIDDSKAPVFKLNDLSQLYVSRMEKFGTKNHLGECIPQG